MPQQIPTSTELTDYRQVTNLDGRDYVLRFLYNTREDLWYLTISDQDESPIVSGIKVTAEINLLRLVTDPRKPPGLLIARDFRAADPPTNDDKIQSQDPGRYDLGAGVTLLYFTEAEREALGL